MNRPKCNLKFFLTDEMIERAAAIFDLDEATLHKLNDRALLNTEYIRNAILIQDYERLTKGLTYLGRDDKTYTYSEIKQAIAQKYRLTPSLVTRQVQNSTNRAAIYYCKECGVVMKEGEWKRTGGICNDCFIAKINV